jgi:hypothetical protein
MKTQAQHKPKIIWTAAINLKGLWFSKPLRMKLICSCGEEGYCECEEYSYWDKSGDFDVKDIGLIEKDGIITYAHPEKEMVELWMSGIKSATKMIKQWCS